MKKLFSLLALSMLLVSTVQAQNLYIDKEAASVISKTGSKLKLGNQSTDGISFPINWIEEMTISATAVTIPSNDLVLTAGSISTPKTIKLLSTVDSVNAAGANQGNSTALSATKWIHVIAAGDNTTGVVLPAAPAAAVGDVHILISTVQAKLMNIWPAAGATINGAGANAVFVAGIATAGHGQDICIVTAVDTWFCG